jgi:acetyltransferase-like isoleucine patch superfamily enzyme
MAYLNRQQLAALGFMHIGRNSDSAKFYGSELMSIGDNSRIDDFVILSGSVRIGRNVHVAVHSSLNASTNKIVLEDFSGVSFGCHLFAASEDYTGIALTNPTVPAEFRRNVPAADIRLGRHVVIGAGSVVFPGVDLGDGCSVGANSTVTKSSLPLGVYVGSPARRIRERYKDLLEFEQRYLSSEE